MHFLKFLIRISEGSRAVYELRVGGTVSKNMITGERLQDLFSNDTWRDHFEALSDTLGFALSVYSATGDPVYVPENAYPLCKGFNSQSSDLKSLCDSSCRPFLLNTLSMGKPNVFKCHTKIMSFAFPIEYLNEKAVVLGQGSFASYEDFRDCMDMVSAYGIDMITIKTPLSFTSSKQAWKVCRFVADTVSRHLQDMQETVTLRRKFESLKSVFSLWGSGAVADPERRYQDMLYNLSTLLDIDRITVLTLDRQGGRYVSLYGLSRGGAHREFSISLQDKIVLDLQNGKPFVRSAVAFGGSGAEVLSDRGMSFWFPIMISGILGGILNIADNDLKESDLLIISGFCKQTALFIENHRLHEDLYRKFNRFVALSEMTEAIAPIQNYEILLQTILDKSAELLKAEQGSLMVIDQETDNLLIEAKKGVIQGLSGKLKIQRGEGIAGRVAEQGEPILVENLEDDPRIRQKNRQHYKTRSFVSVPLKIDDRIIGVLNLSDKTTGEVFDEEDLKLIQSFATHAAIVLERNVFYNKTEELKKLTITDHLTGLLNRRYLYERLKDELARSERYGHYLSLLMLDLDGFKYCNDTYGHLFGDKILKVIAETLLNTVRSMDIVARYGGDEFMIILPETRESLARDIAERLRNSVAGKVVLPEDAAGAGSHTLTTSIGIVCYPEHGDTLETLLERVDVALYRAKNKGKNRIEVYIQNAA